VHVHAGIAPSLVPVADSIHSSKDCALSRDFVIAGICVLFFLFAFFQLLSGKYLGKSTSVLPHELETKRISIATRHNQIVGVMILSVIVAIFLIVALLRGSPRIWTLLAIAVVGGVEFYVIRRVFKYDEHMCEQLGFICPHCHKPLYEPHSFINLNGQCPKCRKSLLNEAQRSPAAG
jgi:hypothetical protein